MKFEIALKEVRPDDADKLYLAAVWVPEDF